MAIEHVDGKNKGTVMLYALSTCGWCRKTKELLKSLGIEFSYEYVDLLSGDEQKQALDLVRKFNSSASFPTIIIDNKNVIIGFQEEAIRGALS